MTDPYAIQLQREINEFAAELCKKIFSEDQFGMYYLAHELEARLLRMEDKA